ncbi:MAG: MBL fold metallo-hydrolase [Verrucomicrobiota bacterium]
MNLEDHVGDIIRKARQMNGVTAEAVAQAIGLPLPELQIFEENGDLPKHAKLANAAKLLGLNPEKLQRIADGWTPPEPDLSIWREMRRLTTGDDGFRVHCYLIWDEVTREAALFDTGLTPEPIFQAIQENDLQLKHLFITHSHFDHQQCLPAIREKFPRALLHTGAKEALPQHRNRANDFLHLGSLRITNRDTPGHAEDGVTYIVGNWPEDAPNLAIVGDALFAGSMGKAPGVGELARAKVRQQIFSLPDETLICPGHGPFTTVEQEKTNNPFW